MLSVVIPARNEVYLERTIRNILDNAEGEIEVIAELDGYLPNPPIQMNDKRVIFVYHKESIGQRACINHAASIAKGKYIMKLDAHCAVDKGFDVKLAANCESDWTVIPRMYNLDHETWLPKCHKVTDYMYFTGPNFTEKPFRAEYYKGREFKKWHNRTEMIDDTMACMGPGWFMHRARFLEQGGCDEGHGGWGQQGIEVSLKAWLSGGRLVVNKNTWFAHWFRGGGGPGFPYPASGREHEAARKYSQDLWLNDKWPLATRKLDWVIRKFQPPTWEKIMDLSSDEVKDLFRKVYHHAIKKMNYCRWKGIAVLKLPQDLALYQKMIWEQKPDFIIETGTKWGGATTFFADLCELNGKGHVISVDIAARATPQHKRITYLKGDSKSPEIIAQLQKIVGDKTVMVILDSYHGEHHVMWELHRYSKLVTKGQYMVVEDCYSSQAELTGPGRARDWFLKRTKRFKLEKVHETYLFGLSMNGWLKRIK
jgi:cephalosporin hydroxylase